ncbi:excisionase family DNA-binding protein [Streptomyces sp. HNM0663]|uniref:Excisionase family DNA-binding protein n=1 Tax=Streptomyces chengmaiensis TaxID=3040919 RepID=A0ABT6HJ92_9ACTN|nr:excisionase family DNA-binding protein [Streptomyces chengmaiensis]MDH2388338.1 excisionase family DNA-binding protein [Streptomyces chengmaiensis]
MSVTRLDTARASKANGPAPVLLTVEEAACCLRIGRTTCFALIRSGELESLMIGGLRRVPADAPAAYLARRRAERRAA